VEEAVHDAVGSGQTGSTALTAEVDAGVALEAGSVVRAHLRAVHGQDDGLAGGRGHPGRQRREDDGHERQDKPELDPPHCGLMRPSLTWPPMDLISSTRVRSELSFTSTQPAPRMSPAPPVWSI